VRGSSDIETMDIIYSDTDSIILANTIDDSLIGSELGQMKDELDGKFMNECYVLGMKQYGYHYDSDDVVKECSIFAGVPRNSINFKKMLKNLHKRYIKKIIEQVCHIFIN